jgi:hypothetical protein
MNFKIEIAMNYNIMRQFEEWARTNTSIGLDLDMDVDNGVEHYWAYSTYSAWEAWQAAREQITEKFDELLRYNEAFRKETLICADCDAIRKEEYDQAIEQRDRLQKIVDEQCRVSSVCREYREQRDRAWQTIAEIKRDIMEDETFGDVVIKLWQEPLDEAIEQRDRLAEALKKCIGWTYRAMDLEVSGSMLEAASIDVKDATEALQSLTTNETNPAAGSTLKDNE